VVILTMVCPSCGGIHFATPGRSLLEEEIVGAACGGCGNRLTQEDVNHFVESWAAKLGEEAMKAEDPSDTAG
jgi:hypothetical protein